VERHYLMCMTTWLRRIDPEMTLQGIPALRRHIYFLAVLFLTSAVANQALINFSSGDTGFADSPEAQELVRIQEMAATARSLYE